MNAICFGIVGTSPIARSFIEACRAIPEIKVQSIYSRTAKAGREFAKEMNITDVFTDYTEMLRTTEISAVYIASPNALHFEHTRLALESGKSVLCEKPFTSNVKELNVLIKLAKEKKLLIMEAMKSLAMPAYRVIKENLSQIGTVRKAVFNFCQYSSKYPAFQRGENPNIFNPAFSAGALMDIGIYCIYPCIDLMGMPDSLHGIANKMSNGIDGSGSVLFAYPDKEAVVTYSKINDSSIGSEIMGENGSLYIDFISAPMQVELRKKGEPAVVLNEEPDHLPMYYEVREFVDTLIKGQTESKLYPFQLLQNVMAVLDEIRQQIGLVFPADHTEDIAELLVK